MGQPELRDFCLVEHVLKKRELIGLLLSRVGQRLLLLGTCASPIATESFRRLADKILVPKRPSRISVCPGLPGSQTPVTRRLEPVASPPQAHAATIPCPAFRFHPDP